MNIGSRFNFSQQYLNQVQIKRTSDDKQYSSSTAEKVLVLILMESRWNGIRKAR